MKRRIFELLFCVGGGALLFHSAHQMGASLTGDWMFGFVAAMLLLMIGGNIGGRTIN